MRLLKNIFFSKQTEMTMTKCHILRSRKAQQISICNDVILKICRDKYCKFLFQVQRLSFPGCAWQDPLPRRWLWSNGLQFFKYKTFSNTTSAYVSPIPDLKTHHNQSQAAPTTCKLHPDAFFPAHTTVMFFSHANLMSVLWFMSLVWRSHVIISTKGAPRTWVTKMTK